MIIEEKKPYISNDNKLLENFLREDENLSLLKLVLNDPTAKNKKKLDDKFKDFYFEIRFTSYVISLIRFSSIDFDKKRRSIQNRFCLVWDSSSHAENNQVKSLNKQGSLSSYSEKIEEIFLEERLSDSISSLNEKEKKILSLIYIGKFTETEISKFMRVSQQAVSKIKRKALSKIKQQYIQLGGDLHE